MNRLWRLLPLLAALLAGCGSGNSTPSGKSSSLPHPAHAQASSPARHDSNRGSSPSNLHALIAKLRRCGIPSVGEARAVLSGQPSAAEYDLTRLQAKYEAPPPPPYDVAPNYAVPKSSCDYEAPGGIGGDLFAISWYTDTSYFDQRAGTVPADNVKMLSPPPGAMRAFTDDFGTDVRYPGIWLQWSKQDDPDLDTAIESRIRQCLQASC
jgi:hypothetical protein